MESFDLRKWPEYRKTAQDLEVPAIINQVAIDSRRIFSKNALFIALPGVNYDGHNFIRHAFRSGARFAVIRNDSHIITPPKGLTLIKVDDPLRALQDIAKLYRKQMSAKVIAIVGSYGKTMLKDLLKHIVSFSCETYASPESFNSQIGVALSLLRIQRCHQIAIIEAGISKAGEMERLAEIIAPDHVIVTNIAKTRIGTIGNEELLAAEKLRIIRSTPQGNWGLYPLDIHIKSHLEDRLNYFWSERYPELPHIVPIEAELERALDYELLFPDGTPFRGTVKEGNAYVLDLLNIATKAAHLLKVSREKISTALTSYFPEPMRIEVWKSQNQITFVNDTYCADPMSCDVALKQLTLFEENISKEGRKKIFLFGGLRNGSEHPESDMARIAHAIARHHVNLLVLWQPKIAAQLVPHVTLLSPNTTVVVCKDIMQAIRMAKEHIRPQDVVLVKGGNKIPINDILKEFEESLPNNQVIINLAAIQSNIEMLRAKLDRSKRVMVMVKALAYGTDDVRIAKFLRSCGIDILGVSYVDEGVSIRQAGVMHDIFVLNATEYEAAKAVKWNLEVGVSERRIIQALQAQAAQLQKKVKVHLHLDTGMNRFGCRKEAVVNLAREIHNSPNLILEGLMTHFACADNPAEDTFSRSQASCFKEAIELLEKEGICPKWRHAASSSASIRFDLPFCNMVRLGLAVYGLHTSPTTRPLVNLRPAISLVSRIVGVNECRKGDTISYGRIYEVTQDRARIAVLPIGYFDGLHRNYSGKGHVMIRGKRAPMIGRICMDYMMVDITNIPQAHIGDQVLLFGEDENGQYVSPEELAHAGGSIVHELMTCLGPRIQRLFIYDESLRPR